MLILVPSTTFIISLRNWLPRVCLVFVVSDDTAEVIATCDRVMIMQGGHITGKLDKSDLTEQNLAKAAN